jgi:hypothetical protein
VVILVSLVLLFLVTSVLSVRRYRNS